MEASNQKPRARTLCRTKTVILACHLSQRGSSVGVVIALIPLVVFLFQEGSDRCHVAEFGENNNGNSMAPDQEVSHVTLALTATEFVALNVGDRQRRQWSGK